MNVLVTDGHWRKTLAVVRSLGRKGIRVTVGERTFLNTSFFSKYCSRRIVYPSPRRHPDPFIEFLLEEIKNRFAVPFLIVANKKDISATEIGDMSMSTLTGEGVDAVLERLLEMMPVIDPLVSVVSVV